MNKLGHTFSSFDAWVIDVLASLGLGVLLSALLMGIYKGLWGTEGSPDAGGAGAALAILAFIVWLVCLRCVRGRRDRADADPE